MTRTMTIMEARRRLTTIPETMGHEGEADVIEVTRRGKPVLAVMPWELYESVTETLEILADAELLQELRKSISQMQEGRVHSWQDARKKLAK